MSKVAIISFPGTNNEVESVRAIRRAGMEPVCVKWNDDSKKLSDFDGYFLVGGFSYEDRGRAGMVAARDSMMDVLKKEASKGKAMIGHCNGAQILVESGLIPLGKELSMSLARNAIKTDQGYQAPGFLNEWIYITPSCKRHRCVTSDWEGVIQVPIAHGEGRYVTIDQDVMQELQKNDQLAFQYCDENGNVSEDPAINPNGAMLAAAGICNPEGNVVALMPHPERTRDADMYFASMKKWIEKGEQKGQKEKRRQKDEAIRYSLLATRSSKNVEIFIDTIITNNEERTVEQAAKRIEPSLRLKQYRYIAPGKKKVEDILGTIALFNPHKEIAYIRKDGEMLRWDAKKQITKKTDNVFCGIPLLRKDIPDTEATSIGDGSETGICYDIRAIDEQKLSSSNLLEVFFNPHASTLEKLHT